MEKLCVSWDVRCEMRGGKMEGKNLLISVEGRWKVLKGEVTSIYILVWLYFRMIAFAIVRK